MSNSAIPWPVAHQAPLSMGSIHKNSVVGCYFLSPGDLPGPEIELASPILAGGFFTINHQEACIYRFRDRYIHTYIYIKVQILTLSCANCVTLDMFFNFIDFLAAQCQCPLNIVVIIKAPRKGLNIEKFG